jgi:signal transduction histidine kinase
MARLELDELLVQLVERAQDVMATRDRLKGLLQATRLIAAELALPVVLRRIVESARGLVEASYAALGVIDEQGGLAQFVHIGIDAQKADEIGELPRGRGILGLLIDDPRAVRLADLHQHEASAGFPEHHPPMRSFLGVPIRIRDEVYGNLYLTDKKDGRQFTAEDEELVTALAITAGVAIENARLFEEVSRRQRWQEATARITTALLSPGSPDALAMVMDEGRWLVDADDVAITRPAPGREMEVQFVAAKGDVVGPLVGTIFPMHGTLTALVQSTGPVVFADVLADDRVALDQTLRAGVGPVIAVPLASAGRTTAVLTVTRRKGRDPFTTSDLDLITHFGEQAALALEVAQARADAERVNVLEDRDRIARDMHDHVIGRLFGAGMSAHGLVRWIPEPAGRQRLSAHVDDLDAVIRDIRTSIFALDHDPVQAWSLSARVQQVVSEAVGHLGFAPTVQLDSGIDLPTGSLTEHNLLAVLREALSNVARHANAGAVQVTLTGGPIIHLTVTDDGQGLPEHRRPTTIGGGHGLANMSERATTLGGSFSITTEVGVGSTLQWSAPASS